MVERFFRSISTDQLKRGVFRSVLELEHSHSSGAQKPMTFSRKPFAPIANRIPGRTKH